MNEWDLLMIIVSFSVHCCVCVLMWYMTNRQAVWFKTVKAQNTSTFCVPSSLNSLYNVRCSWHSRKLNICHLIAELNLAVNKINSILSKGSHWKICSQHYRLCSVSGRKHGFRKGSEKEALYTAQVLLSKETILSAAGSINGFSMYFLNLVS